MSMELLEVLTRMAELERKLDSLFRHGPVHDRKKIEGRWFVRLKIGGTADEPFLSPWIPYSLPNGGPQGLNVHRVPTTGEQLTMLSPAGDFRQAVAVPLFWSDDHPAPSEDEDAVTITHPKFKLNLKDGVMTIESSEQLVLRAKQSARIVAPIITFEGEVHLGGDGGQLVHRKGDVDSRGDHALTSATKVYAV